MLNDRFVKGMLAVIAVLLALNLWRSYTGSEVINLGLESSAEAQTTLHTPEIPKRYIVKNIQGFNVADLKDVVALGDGKSFVVSNPKGFMVYQVEVAR